MSRTQMFDIQSKIKRQIEILGLCFDVYKKRIYTPLDLADEFNVDEITIKRDLKDLRFMGIDVHSSKQKGVYVSTPPDKEKIRQLLLYYVGLCYSANIFDKSTTLLIAKQDSGAISNFVLLQICIDKTQLAKITYHNHEYELEERTVKPLLIFHSEGSWRLLTQEGGKVKQFHLDKIAKVVTTETKFERMSNEQFEELFKHSWGSWIGDEKVKVKIKLDNVWGNRIKDRMLVDGQIITEQEDGTFLFEATVNTINEIASWVVSRGKGCIVLEPEELRTRVIQIAKEALENYSN